MLHMKMRQRKNAEHTCNKCVLPGYRGHVVAVDIPFKLEHFGRLQNKGKKFFEA